MKVEIVKSLPLDITLFAKFLMRKPLLYAWFNRRGKLANKVMVRI